MRLLIVLPCCIGDVVMGTAALGALRRAYPAAHITWAVGGWSLAVLERHPHVDALLGLGDTADPARGVRGLLVTAGRLQRARPDVIVCLSRSVWMALACALSGARTRVGPDAGGRGLLFYTRRVAVMPDVAEHEAQLYLRVAAAAGAETRVDDRPFVPIHDDDVAWARATLGAHSLTGRYLVVNPSGGRNPGAVMDAKRWPPERLAAFANALAPLVGAQSVLVLAGPGDDGLAGAVAAGLVLPHAVIVGRHNMGSVAALAVGAALYVGHDTGLTHLAAAAGARTVAIFGPTDPARYAPSGAPGCTLALWTPTRLPARGAAAGAPPGWDWARDGLTLDDALARTRAWLGATD